MPPRSPDNLNRKRRAIVIVQAAMMVPVLFAFAVLVVDLGVLYYTKGDLQRAADAAALAGASAYFSDSRLAGQEDDVADLVRERAQSFSLENPTLGEATTLEVADAALGRHDFDNPTGPMLNEEPYNAVELLLRRQPDSTNGPVPFFFAGLFGRSSGSLTTRARAAMDDRFAGLRAEDGWFLPFTVHRLVFDYLIANGPDDFSYDDGVWEAGDGVREVTVFPWDEHSMEEFLGEDYDGAGNFGTLRVGTNNNGTSDLEAQILNGITAADLAATFGTAELMFYDEQAGPNTYQAPGNPGLSLGMRDALEQRIGDVVSYFIHTGVVSDGANATYTISGIGFGRVMEVHLTGNPSSRRFTIQPVAYAGGNVVVNPTAPQSNGLLGRVVLVQ